MAKTIDIGPRIGVSVENNFFNTMKAIESQIRANGKSLKKLKEEYEENDKAAKNLSDRQNVLQSSISAGKQKVKALTGEYERQKKELDRLEINLDSVKQMYGENSAEALKAEKAYMRQATEVNNLAGKISTAEGQIAGFNRELKENEEAIRSNKAEVDESERALKAYEERYKTFESNLAKIDSQISSNGKTLRELKKEYKENDNAVKSLSDRQMNLQSGISNEQQTVKTLTEEYSRQKQELKHLEKNLEAVKQQHGADSDEAIKAKNAYEKQAEAVRGLRGRISIAEGQLVEFNRELQDNATQLYEAQSKAKAYGDTLERVGDKISPIGDKLSKAGTALTIGVTTPLLAAGTAMVKYASDEEESRNKVKEAFKGAAKQVEDFAETTVESVGIAKGEALDMAALFGDMGTSMGLPEEEAAKMSTTLVGLAGDLASFKNIRLDEAQTALKGIFTGETESLKNLGVVMTETNLQAWAMEQGLLSATKTTAELEKQQIAVEKAQSAYNKAIEQNGANSIEAREAKIKLAEAEEKLNEQATASWGTISQEEKVMLRYKYVMEQTSNAHGDYQRTASGTANSLRTLQERAKEAAVEFGQELLPAVTPLIQTGTKLLKKVSELDDEEKKLIIRTAGVAAAAGPLLNVGGKVISTLGKASSGTGKLLKDIGKLHAAKKGAASVGMIGTEAMKSVEGVSMLSRVLTALASPTGALVVGATAALGLGAAVAASKEEMVKADIAAHFGNIKLSAEEVEDVASRLTTTEWKMKIDAVINAKAELEQAEKDLKSSLETIEKLDWKVKIGLELTEEEKGSYKTAADDFVKQCQDYVNKQGYTISLAIDATAGKESDTGSGLTEFCNTYFQKASEKLENLGETLAECVNLSFENNTFGENLHISNIINQMNEVIREIQNAEYQAELDNLKIEYAASGIGVDKESFEKLNEKISEDTETLLKNSEEGRKSAIVGVNLQYQTMIDSGATVDFAERVKEKSKADIEQSLKDQQGQAINVGFDFAFDTLSNNFGEQIEQAKGEVESLTGDFFSSITEAMQSQDSGLLITWFSELESSMPQMSEAAKRTVNEALSALSPHKETLEKLRDESIAAGRIVPESVKEGLENISAYEAMAGNVTGMFTTLAKKIADDPEKLQVTLEAVNSGKKIPDELGKAISMYANIPYDAVSGLFTEAKRGAEVSQEEVLEYLNGAGTELDQEFADSIAESYGLVYKNGQYMIDKAAKGIKDRKPILTSAANEVGTEANTAMGTALSSTNLKSPKIDPASTIDSAIAAGAQAVLELQKTLDQRPAKIRLVTESVNVGLDVGINALQKHAAGGIFSAPHVAMVAEEAPGEAIIPLSPARRDSAIELLNETAALLGYDHYEYAASMGRSRGDRIRQKNERPAEEAQITTYKIEEGAVQTTIHTAAQDPEGIYRLMKRQLTRDVNKAVRGKGR